MHNFFAFFFAILAASMVGCGFLLAAAGDTRLAVIAMVHACCGFFLAAVFGRDI